MKREEREKHLREIAESAASENKDANEKKMRQNFQLHKMWNSFMRKKMEKEMKESAEIDDAFKRIKTATGVNDVQELVHKFLTREETYDELLIAVADSENRIDRLRKQNEDVRARLHELKIGSNDEVAESEEISKLKEQRELV